MRKKLTYTYDSDGILRAVPTGGSDEPLDISIEYYPVVSVPETLQGAAKRPEKYGRARTEELTEIGTKIPQETPPSWYWGIFPVHPRWEDSEMRSYGILTALIYMKPDGILACRLLSDDRFPVDEAEEALKAAGVMVRKPNRELEGRNRAVDAMAVTPSVWENRYVNKYTLKRAMRLARPYLEITDVSLIPDEKSSKKAMSWIRMYYNSLMKEAGYPENYRNKITDREHIQATIIRNNTIRLLSEKEENDTAVVSFNLRPAEEFENQNAYIKKHAQDYTQEAFRRLSETILYRRLTDSSLTRMPEEFYPKKLTLSAGMLNIRFEVKTYE